MSSESNDRHTRTSKSATEGKPTWKRPAIEWEEDYEPVVFSASCTAQPFNCGSGARD